MEESVEGKRDRAMMRVALLVATRTKVGAVIVDEDGCIISSGVNSRPKGCEDFPYKDNWMYSVHAEMDAILRCSPKGCTIYVSAQPCNECAKLIVRSGIARVVYMDGPIAYPPASDVSLDILTDAKVDIRVEPECDERPSKRDFDELMMEVAKVVGKQNETGERNVGALIVDSKEHIVSSGYPRKPRECQREGTNSTLPCGKADQYAIHADADAIVGRNVKGCTLYLTKYPCNASARMISMSGIVRVVTYESNRNNRHEHGAAADILRAGDVDINLL